VPTTLELVDEAGRPVWVTGARAAVEEARRAGVPVYSPAELRALAIGIDAGRVLRRHVDAWTGRKRGDVWHLTAEAALGGANPPEGRSCAKMGNVCHVAGWRLKAVRFHEVVNVSNFTVSL
jgi:hypothetical protein